MSTAPYLLAPRQAPAGTAFTGIFFYQDDVYQYLSFVEQASHGRVLFLNKFDPVPRPGRIVNVEWWAAGVLALLCGGRLLLGFHLLGLLALAAVVFGARRLLAQGGLAGRPATWALALFATAGGLGWLRLLMGAPGWIVPDLLMGMYPWHQALMNPHFVWGTALLLWSASWYLDFRRGRGPRWPWVVSGAVLGLSRPYDLATLVGLVGVLAVADLLTPARRAEGRRHLFDALWLLPAALYYALLIGGRFGLSGWTGAQAGDLNPPGLEFLPALLPAGLAAAVFWRGAREAGDDAQRLAAGWCLLLLAVVLFYPSPMAKQHATSLGTATVLLAALVTPPRWLPALCLACLPTSAFVWWQVAQPRPDWFLPRDYFTATRALASSCRPRDVLVAPTDLSLMAAGLTPCSVALGHRALTPRWTEKVAEGRRFYDPATPPEWRRAYLDGLAARFVALPAGRGAWLAGSAFQVRLATPLLELWERVPGVD